MVVVHHICRAIAGSNGKVHESKLSNMEALIVKELTQSHFLFLTKSMKYFVQQSIFAFQ